VESDGGSAGNSMGDEPEFAQAEEHEANGH